MCSASVQQNGSSGSHNDVGEQQPLLGGVVGAQRYPEPGVESWREWIAERLESRGMHKFVLSLITIDALCVLADLTYTVLEPECPQPLGGPGGVPHASPHALVPTAQHAVARLVVAQNPEPVWLNILAHVSFSITTLFVFEIPLALWCFGLRYYVPLTLLPNYAARESRPEVREGMEPGLIEGQLSRFEARELCWRPYAALHLFDAFIVLTTFIFEAVLHGPAYGLAGLLIILRLWRIVKLVGGMAVGAGELTESLSKELEATHRRIAYLERENATLRSCLVSSASSS